MIVKRSGLYNWPQSEHLTSGQLRRSVERR